VPKYDPSTGKIVDYSSLALPKALTSPRFVISNVNRDKVVLSGTICESGRRSRDGAIFTGKDRSLADGTYVFRIDGALSREHTSRNTKWELCGRRGTSDEELKFRMNQGVCIVLEHRSRWEMTGALVLADFSGTLSMILDDQTTINALDDEGFNEVFWTELESVLFVALSGLHIATVGVSVVSLSVKDDVFEAAFEIRLNTALCSVVQSFSRDEKNQLLAAELQSQLASHSSVSMIIDELHKYPEFATVSNAVVSDVKYDGDFYRSSQEGRHFDSQLDGQSPSNLYYVILASFGGVLVALIVAMRKYIEL
jgi:hypothetical protein